MSKSNAFETDLLELIFNAVAIAGLAEDDTSSPVTDLYVSLHTADPGESSTQTSNETTYGDYARVAVPRDGTGWIVSGSSVSPAAPIIFPEIASGTGTITHVGIGTDPTGAGYLLYKGSISPSIPISVGESPTLSIASTITED